MFIILIIKIMSHKYFTYKILDLINKLLYTVR